MASVASQLIEEVTAHAQIDSLEDAREICADGTYFPNNLRTWCDTWNKEDIYIVLTPQSFLPIVLSSKVYNMQTFTEKDILVAFCTILLLTEGIFFIFEGWCVLIWNNQANYVWTKRQSNPITSLERPRGFQEVEASRFQDNRHINVVSLSTLLTGHL